MNLSTLIISTIVFGFVIYQIYRIYKKRGQVCETCDCVAKKK